MFRCCSAHFSGQRAHIVKGAARGLVVCASKRHAYTWHNTAKTPQHDRLKPVAQQAAELPASRAHGWIQPQTPPKRMHHTGLALGGGGTCGRRRVAVFGGVSGELRRRVRPSSDCTALPVPWWSPRGCTTPCAAVVTCGGQCQLHGAPSQADSTGLLVCTRRRAGRQTMQSLRGACSPPPTRCRRASTAPGGGGGGSKGQLVQCLWSRAHQQAEGQPPPAAELGNRSPCAVRVPWRPQGCPSCRIAGTTWCSTQARANPESAQQAELQSCGQRTLCCWTRVSPSVVRLDVPWCGAVTPRPAPARSCRPAGAGDPRRPLPAPPLSHMTRKRSHGSPA